MKLSVPKPRITIIIPSWNTKLLLKQCLCSLEADAGEYEVIVIDNGSKDDSAQMVEKDFPKVKLIKNKENLGFSKANNQGAKEAKGGSLFFLNSDTIVEKGAVEKLERYLLENPKAAAVSPLLLNQDGSVQLDPCYLRFPTALTVLIYYNKYFRSFVFNFFPSLLLSIKDLNKPTEVDQLPGAALMVRKNIFKEAGGFDERFPIYFEDMDLSFQIKKTGFKLFVVPESKIIHLGRKSIEPVIAKEGKEKFLYLNFNSLFLFCEKNYSEFKVQLIKLAVFINLFLGFKFGLIRKLLKR